MKECKCTEGTCTEISRGHYKCDACGGEWKDGDETIPGIIAGINRHDIKPESILLEAEKIVNGDRDADYGDSNQNLDNIAGIAKAIGVDIDPVGVCKVMIAVKLGREKYKHKKDNLVDCCGYLELMNRYLESK